MSVRAIFGALVSSLGVATVSGASAEVLFIDDSSNTEAYASAFAGGGAYGAGNSGGGRVLTHVLAVSRAFSANAGIAGSFSVGSGFATSNFSGSGSNSTSVTGVPTTTTSVDTRTETSGEAIITTTTTTRTTTTKTTTTKIERSESLAAFASNFQDLTSQFVSPSLATFAFSGVSRSVLLGAGFTRISSTPTIETTIVTDMKVSTSTSNGTTMTDTIGTISKTATGPTIVTVTEGPALDPNGGVTGYAEAEASIDNSSNYTFEITGSAPGKVAVRFQTPARFNAPLAYEMELVNDTTDALVGPAQWIDSNANGEELFFVSPGIYSLIVSEQSDVRSLVTGSADADGAGWSRGIFRASITTVPELSTWGMAGIGFAGVGLTVFQRARRALKA